MDRRQQPGGGIYCGSPDATISSNIISGNSASCGGGGIYCGSNCSPTINYNVISGNSTGDDGGGICCKDADPTIGNNTISRNSAGDGGGGIACTGYISGSSPNITNTILWENIAGRGPEICVDMGNPTVSYCDVQGGWPGQGNIDCDPLFRDPGNGDFQITWENYPEPDSTKSCCIDAGDPESPKDPDSTRVDIGALYFHRCSVEMACECLTPLFCKGKNFYFKLTVTNNAEHNVSGTLAFSGYSAYDCDPGNLLVSIRRSKTYPPGTTDEHYFFKPPSSVGPGHYSTSVAGVLDGNELFCCMNTDIVQCGPWRMGHNTEWDLVEVDRPEVGLPTVSSLAQNYPNPFNASTVIEYQLPVSTNVTLEVYNLLGEKVATLVDKKQQAGYRSVVWDASRVSSGLYFYRLTAGDFTEAKTMMLVK